MTYVVIVVWILIMALAKPQDIRKILVLRRGAPYVIYLVGLGVAPHLTKYWQATSQSIRVDVSTCNSLILAIWSVVNG
jgi:hypothetical protein